MTRSFTTSDSVSLPCKRGVSAALALVAPLESLGTVAGPPPVPIVKGMRQSNRLLGLCPGGGARFGPSRRGGGTEPGSGDA
jgi:hypothetical protein